MRPQDAGDFAVTRSIMYFGDELSISQVSAAVLYEKFKSFPTIGLGQILQPQCNGKNDTKFTASFLDSDSFNQTLCVLRLKVKNES